MATFNQAIPDRGASMSMEPRLLTADFGGGYSQSGLDGINPFDEVWTLSFTNRTKAVIVSIDTFLRANAGISFDWTTPMGDSKKFECRSWRTDYEHDTLCSAFATFKEVHRT